MRRAYDPIRSAGRRPTPSGCNLCRRGHGLQSACRSRRIRHSGGAHKQTVDSDMTNLSDVIGIWRLRSCYLEIMETGERIEPYGARPNGVFMIHPDGRVAVVMTSEEQRKPATAADQAEAFQKLVAYSGLYRVEPPDRLVTAVDIAWFEPWVGSEQARRFAVKGDTLEIVSEPTRSPLTGDALVIGVLSWIREGKMQR